MSVDLSGIYETEGGWLLEIKNNEDQWEAVFHYFGWKRILKLDGEQVQDETARLKGKILGSGDIQFDKGYWWKKQAGPRLRFKYDDCSTGWLSDLNPKRWSSLMSPTGIFASVITDASDQNGAEFFRPLLVQQYESVLSKSPAKAETITDYPGLLTLLVSPDNRAFQWRRRGRKVWSDWMSKAELCRDVRLQNPDLSKSHIEINVFHGNPGGWATEHRRNIGSEEAFKAALYVTPALKLTRLRTPDASATVVAARLAENIYKDPAPSWASTADLNATFFGVTEVMCSEGYCIFVVFRGTFDMMTAVTDLKCNLDDDEPWSSRIGIHVHAGIWNDLKSAWRGNSGILSRLVKLWKSKENDAWQKLVLTGHSLGGGMAMMLHAYIWILLNCEAKDFLGSGNESEERDFQKILRSARCYAFAGPMVFAQTDSLGEGSWQNEFINHMVTTATNFMFRDDLVPRAYSCLDIEDTLKKFGEQVSKTYRKLGRVARILRYDPESIVSGTVSTFLSPNLSAYKKFASKYSHCCMVEVIGQRSLPWYEIHGNIMESLTHHSMKTYRVSVECREDCEGFFQNFPVSFEKQERPSPLHALAPPELWKMAQAGEWHTVLMALEAQSESLDKFLHLAAVQHKRHAIIGICRLGANPLSRPDGMSIVESSERNGEAEEFSGWLQKIMDVAENLHSAGNPLKDVAKEIAKEWDESRRLPDLAIGDQFRQLKVENLLAECLTQEQIESDENMHETFEEAMERILKQLPEGQLDKQKRDKAEEEKVHEFLDAAKFFDYDQMYDMLQRDPSLSSRTVCGRWSAIMQVVYNSILSCEFIMDDVIKLLGNYPSLATMVLVQLQADIEQCVAKAKTDRAAPPGVRSETSTASVPVRRRRGRASTDSSVDGDQDEIHKQINDYKKNVENLINEINEISEKHPESNMQALVEAAMKRIREKEYAGQVQQQDTH